MEVVPAGDLALEILSIPIKDLIDKISGIFTEDTLPLRGCFHPLSPVPEDLLWCVGGIFNFPSTFPRSHLLPHLGTDIPEPVAVVFPLWGDRCDDWRDVLQRFAFVLARSDFPWCLFSPWEM